MKIGELCNLIHNRYFAEPEKFNMNDSPKQKANNTPKQKGSKAVIKLASAYTEAKWFVGDR